jgi:Cof subfamily protein (haloacid dehalogenase superfamily)
MNQRVTENILYVSDLDGTLLNNDRKLSRYAIDGINKLKDYGIKFTVATARSADSVISILKDTQINVPVVLMNGVAVFDLNNKKYIKKEFIPKNLVETIMKIFDFYKIKYWMYSIPEEIIIRYYTKLEGETMNFYQERFKTLPESSFKKVDDFNSVLVKMKESTITYFTTIDQQDRLANAYNDFNKLEGVEIAFYEEVYGNHPWLLEVFHCNGTKYNGVKFLRDEYNFDKIIGFGDNLNDIPLAKACDEFYSVGNAVNELKCISTGVIGENTSDSVVKFILERRNG